MMINFRFLTKAKNSYIFKEKKLMRMSFSENANLTKEDCLTLPLEDLYR